MFLLTKDYIVDMIYYYLKLQPTELISGTNFIFIVYSKGDRFLNISLKNSEGSVNVIENDVILCNSEIKSKSDLLNSILIFQFGFSI